MSRYWTNPTEVSYWIICQSNSPTSSFKRNQNDIRYNYQWKFLRLLCLDTGYPYIKYHLHNLLSYFPYHRNFSRLGSFKSKSQWRGSLQLGSARRIRGIQSRFQRPLFFSAVCWGRKSWTMIERCGKYHGKKWSVFMQSSALLFLWQVLRWSLSPLTIAPSCLCH